MPARELILPRSRRPIPTRTRLTTRRLPVAVYVTLLVLLPVLVVGGAMANAGGAPPGTAASP